MYADGTLTPKEVIRLCALGTLALGSTTYADLAVSTRHFVTQVIGSPPEITGHSIELLRYEGLIETVEGEGDGALLRITDDGWTEMRTLLTARLRASSTELSKLIVALKFRFMHLLEPSEQRAQVDLLMKVCAQERTRLEDLRRRHAGESGHLVPWLDHDIGLLEFHLAWLIDLRVRLDPTRPLSDPAGG